MNSPSFIQLKPLYDSHYFGRLKLQLLMFAIVEKELNFLPFSERPRKLFGQINGH